MGIPSKIKVGNILYTVKKEKIDDDFGIHSSVNQTITVTTDISKEMQRNVFIHELVHAMFFQMGAFEEQRNEILVQGLTNEIDRLFKLRKNKK